MSFMTEYRYFPPKCQNRACDHEPGRCVRYRSRRCLSGECTHAAQGQMCGVNYELAPPAPKPAPIDLSQPHQFRVDRADGREWSFSHGSFDSTTDHITAVGLAQAEAAATRVKHSYYGALTVYVWQRRGDGVHYRDPVPDYAERYDFPAQPEFDPRNRLRAVD